MAKPKLPSTSEHFATSSASRSYSPARRQNTSSRPHTQRGVPNVNFGPSSSLLAFLATVVASTPSVDGYPLYPESSPPDFLCPFLIAQDPPPLPKSRRSLKRDLGDDEPSLKYFARVERNGFVPDKYVQGEDGRWRKSTWSLYGSTYCKVRTHPYLPTDSPLTHLDSSVPQRATRHLCPRR